MLKALSFLAGTMDHTQHDCLLVAVLSHGEMGIIYAKDTPYKPDFLWSSFTADRCPTLAGKFIIIFFKQAFHLIQLFFRQTKNIFFTSLSG